MKRKDFLLALLVVFIWGTTFTVIKLGISGMPSLVLVAGRYLFTFIPAIFFVRKPNVPWKFVVFYGIVSGILQFAAQFYALEVGMPAGIASVTLQSSAFFTPILAVFFLKEQMNPNKIIGLLIAAVGLMFIGFSKAQGVAYIPPQGIFLILTSAIFWGLGNIIIKFAGISAKKTGEPFNSFSFIVWSSLIPPIPLLAISGLIYPKDQIINSIFQIDMVSFASMLYLAFFATLFGYGVWNYLMAKYPAAKVAPFSLLVPISGFFFAFFILHERVTTYQSTGAAIIILGLIIANYSKSYTQRSPQ